MVRVHADGRAGSVGDLAEAVAAREFFVEYQPQVDTSTSAIVGFEALVRWQHPTRGRLEPDSFIAAAEMSGLIVPIGAFVLGEVCLQMKRWIDAGIAPRTVAVNVSAVQFKAPRGLTALLAATLESTAVDAKRIELELTERVILAASLGDDALAEIRRIGCRLAIDDFGTGYSSLDYVRRFAVDRIKIPENFTRYICTEQKDALIVRSVLDLARELGIDVVVEAVETAEQLGHLTAWGCRYVQGFYFSKPLPADAATTLLRNPELIRKH